MVEKQINSFTGDYYFLSNFYPAPIVIDGVVYSNAESAFQAHKVFGDERLQFVGLTGAEAKKLGRKVNLREDWNLVRDVIMAYVLLHKFTQNKQLRGKLLATLDWTLIEGNTWGDEYWGVCNGSGLNKLGKLLMHTRDIISACVEPVDEEGGIT